MLSSLQLIIFSLEAGFRFWMGVIWCSSYSSQASGAFGCAMWPMASVCLILGTLGKPQSQNYDQLMELQSVLHAEL